MGFQAPDISLAQFWLLRPSGEWTSAWKNLLCVSFSLSIILPFKWIIFKKKHRGKLSKFSVDGCNVGTALKMFSLWSLLESCLGSQQPQWRWQVRSGLSWRKEALTGGVCWQPVILGWTLCLGAWRTCTTFPKNSQPTCECEGIRTSVSVLVLRIEKDQSLVSYS